MTSKDIQNRRAPTTIDRLRTFRAYVARQPTTGWGAEASANGRLRLTAIAGATAAA